MNEYVNFLKNNIFLSLVALIVVLFFCVVAVFVSNGNHNNDVENNSGENEIIEVQDSSVNNDQDICPFYFFLNVLLFYLGSDVMKNLLNNLKFSWNYVKGSKKSIILFLISNLFQIGFSIIAPILSAKIVISLTTNEYIRIINIAVIIFLVDYISDIFGYFINIMGSKIYRETMTEIEYDLGRNILMLENKCLDENGSGLFIQRLTGDTSKISTIYSGLIRLLSEIFRDIGLYIAIFIINKVVFVFQILFFVLIYLLQRKKTRDEKARDKIYRVKNERVSGLVGELVRGARDIKMLNSENDFMNELNNKIDSTNRERYSMNKKTFGWNLLIFHVHDIQSLFMILLLVLQMKHDIIIPSMALVVYNYSNRLGYATNTINSLFECIRDFNLSCERIIEVMDGKKFKKEKFGKKHIDKIKGDFSFEHVCFSYDENKVLDDLSFKVKANSTVAFVGKSGVGKSTIFSLLSKMYDINSGKILIDGIDINLLDKDSIRGNITIISQNPYIFNMSIKDNLRLVKSDLTDEDMIKACRVACLDEFIASLPDGYNTIIGEGGLNLSGGQKQRLAIARALVQKTEIILFDEATSALDNVTQEKISSAIRNMKGEYTIMIIAHRLSTIKSADKIFYISDGKVLMEGSHEYLLKNCKEYKKLYNTEINKLT